MNSKQLCFTYKYFLICSQQIEEHSLSQEIEPTDTGVWGQRSTSYTTADYRYQYVKIVKKRAFYCREDSTMAFLLVFNELINLH